MKKFLLICLLLSGIILSGCTISEENKEEESHVRLVPIPVINSSGRMSTMIVPFAH